MSNSSYELIEYWKKSIEIVRFIKSNIIKSNWLNFKKNQLIRHENNLKNLILPRRELNPGLLGESQLS